MPIQRRRPAAPGPRRPHRGDALPGRTGATRRSPMANSTRSDAIAAAWPGADRGGTRTVLMVRPTPEFSANVALFEPARCRCWWIRIDRRAAACLDGRAEAHRHPAGAVGAGAAGLGEVGAGAGDDRALGAARRCHAGPGRARGHGRRAAAGRHRGGRRRRDPVHQRLDRRAQGRGLPPSPRRGPGRMLRDAFGIAPGGVDFRPSRRSRCSIPRWG